MIKCTSQTSNALSTAYVKPLGWNLDRNAPKGVWSFSLLFSRSQCHKTYFSLSSLQLSLPRGCKPPNFSLCCLRFTILVYFPYRGLPNIFVFFAYGEKTPVFFGYGCVFFPYGLVFFSYNLLFSPHGSVSLRRSAPSCLSPPTR